MPPSTAINWPVTKVDASEAKYTAAPTSSSVRRLVEYGQRLAGRLADAHHDRENGAPP